MAASSSALLLLPLPPSGGSAVRRVAVRCGVVPTSSPAPRQSLGNRRQCLLLLLALSSAVLPSPARSADIPLFGIRKRIEKIEEEAEEIVEEGEKALQKGIEAAEKEIQATEEGIVASASVSLAGNNLLQAGAVAGAEAVGVLVAVSVVNGILAGER